LLLNRRQQGSGVSLEGSLTEDMHDEDYWTSYRRQAGVHYNDQYMICESVNEVTLENLIEYCRGLHRRNRVISFPYKAIRSVDVSPVMREKTRTSIIKYTAKKSNFTDLNPRIIICLTEKRDMLPEGVKIICPNKYLL